MNVENEEKVVGKRVSTELKALCNDLEEVINGSIQGIQNLINLESSKVVLDDADIDDMREAIRMLERN